MDLIEKALRNGRRALSEYESKQVLQHYGVPIPREIPTTNAAMAVSAAAEIGYPVALKACDPTLMHKSEKGVIALNIGSADAVKAAYDRIRRQLDFEPESMLVQEMVHGSRELVIGLTREPQFGPCIMVGLGGVMTEIFSDTAFRVAPFDELEAEDMLLELRCREMLGPFRGQQPADRKALWRTLIAIGRIGLEHDPVAEIDINPIIIDPKGRVAAVDALIVLNPAPAA